MTPTAGLLAVAALPPYLLVCPVDVLPDDFCHLNNIDVRANPKFIIIDIGFEMASYLEEFTEKLGVMSIDSNRYLRHIRMLDQKMDEMKPMLESKQKEFLDKVKASKDRKQDQKALEDELIELEKIQKLLYGMALEKVKVSEQLHEIVT